MSRGICFFVDYSAHCPLLAVALHSLEQYYDGPIHVIYGKHTPAPFQGALEENKRITCSLLATTKDYKARRSRKCWYIKPHVHKESPFDVTLMYDCDHVFHQPFDEEAFDIIENAGLMSFHWDPRPITHPRRWSQRRRLVRILGDSDYKEHSPANGGCIGSADPQKVDEWIRVMEAILPTNDSLLYPPVDEHAAAYVIGKSGHSLASGKWSIGWEGAGEYTVNDAIAVHMQRGGYRFSEVYKHAVRKAHGFNYMGLRRHEKAYKKWNPNAYLLIRRTPEDVARAIQEEAQRRKGYPLE